MKVRRYKHLIGILLSEISPGYQQTFKLSNPTRRHTKNDRVSPNNFERDVLNG